MLDRVRARLARKADSHGHDLESGQARFVPEPLVEGDAPESADAWGFADTHFELDAQERVVLRGGRYALSDQPLPALLPWVRDVVGVPFDAADVNEPNFPPALEEPRKNPSFLRSVRRFLKSDQILSDADARLRRGHGHTQAEIYALRYGRLARVPDLVVLPATEHEVAQLVKSADKYDVCLIPYGGGTNVTDALRCREDEQRVIVAVDMSRMNRVLWIDPVNRMACIQAGAVGRHIMKQLGKYGLTMGHEPDSVEFSTLGGWIATHASGMKKNRYGNIEDLILDMNVVTADGVLSRTDVAPRESTGADPRRWMFGSEGNFGIVTQAVVKLYQLPESQEYGSVLFPDFDSGVAFLYELQREGCVPASVRLVDNLQFQFSMALKPANEGVDAIKSKLQKLMVTKVVGFDPNKMVACTLVFEGSAASVQHEQETVYRLARRHGGIKAGGENGKRGYQLTFGIAYIRDFVMKHYVLAESFETSVPWNRVLALCENVKARVRAEHAARGLPGKPFITCRVTQLYDNGVAVYFYLAYYYKGVENPSQVYAELEHAAREEILRSGGSLSHHHGIGKLREGFLPGIMSEAALNWKRQVKQAVDPKNLFGSGNQALA